MRKKTNEIKIGNTKIGGDNPILIQSMNNTDTIDVDATVKQILELEEAGCEITRVAVKNSKAAAAIYEIKKHIHIPIVADIHFDYNLALLSMDYGADKIRINPGNIGDTEKIKKVVDKAKQKNIPIRVGVNSGSLEKELVNKYKGVTPDGMVESALKNVALLERFDFDQIVISIKSSSVPFTIECYEKISEKTNYPLHLGITESGTLYNGSIKSAVGIGAILSKGISDTIRVSLTSNPVDEITCAKEILKALGLRRFGIEFVSCPTCGRTEIDLIKLANEVEQKCKHIKKNIKVAVMGCAVNGPGESKEADIGVAGGKGSGLIFKQGEIYKKVPEHFLVDTLIDEINKM